MSNHGHRITKKEAYIIDVNMGYGHSRAAHNLKDLSQGEIISANDYPGIPAKDKKLWAQSRKLYEAISRFRTVPVFGPVVFDAMDHIQEIKNFYPRRDLSKPNLQVRQGYAMIRRGLMKHLFDKLAENPLPVITTFFLTAQAADEFNYPGEIYCVTTDTDISRSWAPLDPKKSRIKYFAGNGRTVERLKLYGVNPENIFLTGFPLPKDRIGGAKAATAKKELLTRICNLDPNGLFVSRYDKTLNAELGGKLCREKHSDRPFTLTYTVGGAGAQRRLGVTVMKSLKKRLVRGEMHLNLIGGIRKDVVKFFETAAKELGLKKQIGKTIFIPSFESRAEYFQGLTDILATTDILWTKPSEMSFYIGLGIPIIMAPPLGSQEDFNRIWIQYIGGGVPQGNPKYTDEWLFDWINSGGIAQMAWRGYIEAPTHGTYRIEDIVLGRPSELKTPPLIV